MNYIDMLTWHCPFDKLTLFYHRFFIFLLIKWSTRHNLQKVTWTVNSSYHQNYDVSAITKTCDTPNFCQSCCFTCFNLFWDIKKELILFVGFWLCSFTHAFGEMPLIQFLSQNGREMDINTQPHTFYYLTQMDLPRYLINLNSQSEDMHATWTPKRTPTHT